MTEGVTILVGTTKGAFLIEGDGGRKEWTVSGPHCDGWCINHVVGDPQTGTIWAGGGSEFTGAGVWHSTDGGRTFSLTRLTGGQMGEFARNEPEFARMIGWTDYRRCLTPSAQFMRMWSIMILLG